MLPQCYPNYKTVHRRFQHWCRSEDLREVMADLANELRDEGSLDESEYFIYATLASAKGGGDKIEPTKRGRGVKIMAIADRHGLPLAVSTHAANHHEVTLVQLSFEFYMIEAKPENLIGDRAYDSDKLDDELRQEGIEMISPHRKNRNGPRRKIVAACADTNDDGWWSNSLPGFNGNAVSWFVGNITPRISSDLWSWQPSQSCSGNFEIGSR